MHDRLPGPIIDRGLRDAFWLLRKRIRGQRIEHPSCRRCGYPAIGVESQSCPECGGEVRRVIGATGVIFKGSGFYVTDNRKTNSAAPSTKTESKAEAKTETKAEAKAEVKTEAKSESKPAASA